MSIPDHFNLQAYEYELPPELIAQSPSEQREASRLLVLERSSGKISHRHFQDLPQLVQDSDVLVVNETLVVPALLTGRKSSGGRVELLVIEPALPHNEFVQEGKSIRQCLVKASKPLRSGSKIFLDGGVELSVLDTVSPGRVVVCFPCPEAGFLDFLHMHGQPPLPPYIRKENRRTDRDRQRYQTVYSRVPGAVAAPTAGLHFSRELLSDLQDKGVIIAPLVLHVGPATFLPVRHEDIRLHRMETERYEIPAATADVVNDALRGHRRIIAVGTTSVRALESAATQEGLVRAGPHHTDLFIFPGYQFRVVSGMVTNFHLPASTLLMLVCAFGSYERVMAAYREALVHRYRWYSYGDSCLIV